MFEIAKVANTCRKARELIADLRPSFIDAWDSNALSGTSDIGVRFIIDRCEEVVEKAEREKRRVIFLHRLGFVMLIMTCLTLAATNLPKSVIVSCVVASSMVFLAMGGWMFTRPLSENILDSDGTICRYLALLNKFIESVQKIGLDQHHGGEEFDVYRRLILWGISLVSAERRFDRARKAPGRMTDEIIACGQAYLSISESFDEHVRIAHCFGLTQYDRANLLKQAMAEMDKA